MPYFPLSLPDSQKVKNCLTDIESRIISAWHDWMATTNDSDPLKNKLGLNCNSWISTVTFLLQEYWVFKQPLIDAFIEQKLGQPA